MKIGFHVSISGSIDLAVDRAVALGCNTFQIFTRNPRGWRARPLREEEVKAFKEKRSMAGLEPAYAHTPYLINLASPREEVYTRSIEALMVDIERCRSLEVPYLVTHLGSHLGSGFELGVERLLEAINKSLARAGDAVMILLENGSGSAHQIGSNLEDLRRIIEGVDKPSQVAVCLDTCHAFAAGYEFRNPKGLEKTLKAIEDVIGFEKLRLIHLNDSRGGLGSGVDHHEHIGLGEIGEKGFSLILHSRLAELPMILETPMDGRRSDMENLRKVWELASKASD
ncbi:MAG: deoxyribonuclease IV [Candidatus Bathyarchaeia archaeon]|nr:deoxyribonuclease IV [Candidatus Bathyarchaeota archaeon]